jgi:predicted permease
MRLDTDSLTRLAADFAIPCLVFATIVKAEISWIEFSTMALAGVVLLVLLGIVGGIIIRSIGLSLRVYLPR